MTPLGQQSQQPSEAVSSRERRMAAAAAAMRQCNIELTCMSFQRVRLVLSVDTSNSAKAERCALFILQLHCCCWQQQQSQQMTVSQR